MCVGEYLTILICGTDRSRIFTNFSEEDMTSIRVLLADDNAEFRRVLAEFLNRMPHIQIVGEAANGQEAVDQVERCSPDLVLMDITMPLQNGLEATRIIKERWPSTKVLIATTHENSIYRLQAKEVKADGYVMKSDLKTTLESVLGVPQSSPFTIPPILPKQQDK